MEKNEWKTTQTRSVFPKQYHFSLLCILAMEYRFVLILHKSEYRHCSIYIAYKNIFTTFIQYKKGVEVLRFTHFTEEHIKL